MSNKLFIIHEAVGNNDIAPDAGASLDNVACHSGDRDHVTTDTSGTCHRVSRVLWFLRRYLWNFKRVISM